MADDTPFRAGGIISGFDTNSIIDQLTKLREGPLNALKKKQSGLQTQVSLIGDISSKLTVLKNAVRTLSDSGTLGVKVTSTNTAFTGVASTSSIAGRYDITVAGLASAARAQSAAFGSGATVTGGTLDLTLSGTLYSVNMTDGDSLATVAANINGLGAPLSAVVLNDGFNDYLSIVNRDTGYTIGGAANSALQISESYSGSTGQPLGLAVTDAVNATFSVNGLAFTRRSNVVTDAVPGTTLTLKATTAVAESLLQENDVTGTNTNLTTFVTAYNDVATLLAKDLAITATTDRDSTLAGDSSIRRLKAQLAAIISTEVTGLTTVRSLVDLGVKTDSKTGLLSVDNTRLTEALATDANAVNKVFSTDTFGISAVMTTFVDAQTNLVDGILSSRKKSLNTAVRKMDTQALAMANRLDAYKKSLIVQFSSMEKIIAGLKNAGNFLSQQAASNAASSG